MALIANEYGSDSDSSTAFVEWLRGAGPDKAPTKGTMERRHVVADPATGEQREVQTQPGSIPPEPS